MTRLLLLVCVACDPPLPMKTIENPYQLCAPASGSCTQGTDCLSSTLPVSSGFSGYLCTVTCNTNNDCPQDLMSYTAICVNQLCYTQCPLGALCPYGTDCLTTSDQNNNPVNLCTP